MSITIEKEKDICVVSPEVRLSIKERMAFEGEIIKLSEKGNNKIVIDFSKTKYIDSSCLGVIAGFISRLRETGGDIRLCSINNNIRKILEMTNLHTVITIYEDKNEAVKDFGK
ncbi:MAG TPA: anti-sigma factor antagonist [Firmicutes bacterium]|nr:anti-sigma factor antagonist [Bacillota bacterium]